MLVIICNMSDTTSSIKKEYQNKGLKNSIKSVDKEYHIHYTKSIKSKERKF